MRKALLLFLLATPALCPQEPPVIRVETRLVDVEVVVRSQGGPVDNLTAADFSLFDRGKPQRIAAFSIRRESREAATRPLAENAASNRLYRGGEDPIAPTVILLDTLNSQPEDMAEMRRQLAIYLDKITASDPVAIYTLNKTLNVLQEFTGDLERLRHIVANWTAGASVDANAPLLIADLPATGDAITDGMADAAAKEMTDMANLRRAENTAFALQTIAKHLSGLPGRKKLIWAGAAFPARTSDIRSRVKSKQIEIRNYNQFIEDSIRSLNEAQVAVYPIDPRTPHSASRLFLNDGLETMNLLASGTGGKAFYVVSDIARVVRETFEDSSVTYVLGFYPDSKALDGKYHDIRVRVARDKVDVRHRQGYLASENKPPTTPEQHRLLKAAIEAPLDSTGIGLSLVLIPPQPGAPHDYLLRIETRDLQIQTEQTAEGAKVWTALIAIGSSFPPKGNGEIRDLKLTFTEERLRQVLSEGYLMRLGLGEAPVSERFRVTVQDRITGRVGTLTVRAP